MVELAKAFAVKIDGTAVGVTEASAGGSSVELTLARRIRFGETATVDYTVPAEGEIVDLFNNALAAFADQEVVNETLDPSDTDPPLFDGAKTSQEGDTISVGFNEDIQRATIRPEPVRMLMPLENSRRFENDRADAEYYMDWRWQRGIESVRDAHEYYRYRTRKAADAGNANGGWSDWIETFDAEADLTNLEPGTEYQIEVQGVNDGGVSDSVIEKATTIAPLPAGPTPVQFTGGPYLLIPQLTAVWQVDLTSGPAGTASYILDFSENQTGPWREYRRFTRRQYRTDASWGIADLRNDWSRARALNSDGVPITAWGTAFQYVPG